MDPAKTPLYRFFAPRYWLVWLMLGLLRLLCLFPYRAQLALGRASGRLAMRLLRTRRHNAACNVALCMPELDAPAHTALVRRHFESLGIALFETAMAWWTPLERLYRMVRIEGASHVAAACAQGRGALLIPAHCTTMEIGGALLHRTVVPDIVYQRFSNLLIDEMMRRRRGRAGARLIVNSRPRAVIRALRENRIVWYPPDQTYPPKSSVLAPFFGIPALTNTTPARIAQMTGARVLPCFFERLADDSGYRIRLGPPLEDFAAGNPARDAAQLNELVERQVNMAPDQYLWIHRRFRGRGPGYPDCYA